jgi:hypothetical protein
MFPGSDDWKLLSLKGVISGIPERKRPSWGRPEPDPKSDRYNCSVLTSFTKSQDTLTSTNQTAQDPISGHTPLTLYGDQVARMRLDVLQSWCDSKSIIQADPWPDFVAPRRTVFRPLVELVAPAGF